MTAYYNEIDLYCAEWLKNLMAADLIPQGEVDTRDIREIKPDEIRGYTQYHFFAGCGGWSIALRMAGWADERPVWTGSCPCQPFSTAGKQKGKADERHLWPIWFKLISECRPSVVFGEQVSSAIAHGWLDDVFNDLEAEGYACGAAVLPACSIGKPHKRDRLWFVGHSEYNGRHRRQVAGSDGEAISNHQKGKNGSSELAGTSQSSNVANRNSNHAERLPNKKSRARQEVRVWSGLDAAYADNCDVGDSIGSGLEGLAGDAQNRQGWTESSGSITASWILCPDGKSRPVKPGIRLLANGVPCRTPKLRAYGNAIVPQVAAEFIKAYKDSRLIL